MDDPQRKLTAEQVREAGVEDWRQILDRIKARFRTGDFTTGLTLVNVIGKAAEAANHHSDITLTYTDVIVALHSHDVHGITDRDIDLARHISRAAAELGIEADVSGISQLELGLDTGAGHHLAPFYAALLGAELDRGEPVDASGQVPTVWWQEPDQEDPSVALPDQPFPQRWHFDVWVPHDNAEHPSMLCSPRAARWSVTPPHPPTGSSRTLTATACASALPRDADPRAWWLIAERCQGAPS